MPDKQTDNQVEQPEIAGSEPASRYPDLDQLQQDVSRRLRDNQRFLDHFLDDDFMDELDTEGDELEVDPEDFEEL
jgi:hypothetical protein